MEKELLLHDAKQHDTKILFLLFGDSHCDNKSLHLNFDIFPMNWMTRIFSLNAFPSCSLYASKKEQGQASKQTLGIEMNEPYESYLGHYWEIM